MELSRVKRYRRRHRHIAALFSRNPALILGLGLPFFIATTVSLRAAAVLSIELLVVHMGTMLVALATRRVRMSWVRPMINTAVSTLLMVAVRLWLISLFRGIVDVLGMYIYLMAVNGMTVVHSNTLDRRAKPGPVLARAFLNVLGFSAVLFLVSLFREYFGAGTLWGNAVPVPLRMSGILLPFFGFLLAGFLIAGARFLNKRLLALALREQARKDARFSVVRGH